MLLLFDDPFLLLRFLMNQSFSYMLLLMLFQLLLISTLFYSLLFSNSSKAKINSLLSIAWSFILFLPLPIIYCFNLCYIFLSIFIFSSNSIFSWSNAFKIPWYSLFPFLSFLNNLILISWPIYFFRCFSFLMILSIPGEETSKNTALLYNQLRPKFHLFHYSLFRSHLSQFLQVYL